MDQDFRGHVPSLGRTSRVLSLEEANAQIRKLADMVKNIKELEGCCLAETAEVRKDEEQLVRDLERLDVVCEKLRHERDRLDLLLVDEQVAREQAEKKIADLQKEVMRLKQQLKLEKQKDKEVEKVAGIKEKLEALKKVMEDVLI
ncbi:hypothetical protein E8E11_001813 [Didymella keratinophila]|nr:hypothetical protein E8E11_001813 [Didymella keratinophila]